MGNISRRKTLISISGVAAMALAGCAGNDETSADDESVDPDDDTADGNGDDTDDESESESSGYADEQDEQVEVSYGEQIELSNGVVATAHGFVFEDQLGNPDFPSEPDEGYQYALLEFEATNNSDEAERLPRAWMDFQLLHNGSQYDTATVLGLEEYEEYDGGEVQPGVTREGVVVFEVPEDTDESDLDLVWHDDFLGSNINIRWSG